MTTKERQAATQFLHHARPGSSRHENQRQFNVTLNYLDLGDSITAIQIVARARGGGLAIMAPQLFEALTVAALAKVTSTFGGEADSPSRPGTAFELADLGETDLARLTELLQ